MQVVPNTLHTKGLLIPSARALIHNEAVCRDDGRAEQRGQDGLEEDDGDQGKKGWYYEPLKPFELPIVSKTPHIEPGRVEIRLMSLMDALGKIE